MKFIERLGMLFKTLNPDAYDKLCREFSLLGAWKQFFFNYSILFALMLLLFVPAVLLGAAGLQAKLAGFDAFTLGGNFSASEPVVLLRTPDIVVDLTGDAAMTNEEVLFTKEGVSWKPWLLFGETSRTWDEISDLTGASRGALFLFLLFLAPSLAFWAGTLFLVGYLLIAIVASIFAFTLPRVWRHKVPYATALKLCLFAATVMMAVELLLLPFYRNWWLPVLLYVVFLAIGIALVGDRELSGGKGKDAKKGRQHEIWD